MYGARSIQAPDPQYAPMLSAEAESATSGALPPRIAAMILSSLIPPTLSTVTFGYFFSKAAMFWLKTPSSRFVNPLQTVTVAGSFLSNVWASPELPESPPPHAASATDAPTAARIAASPVPRLPSSLNLVTSSSRVAAAHSHSRKQ